MEKILEKEKYTFIVNDIVRQIIDNELQINNELQPTISPIYKNDEIILYNADCLKVMTSFPDNYVDMIFADPPYNLSNDGITCYAGKMISVNKGKWDKSNGFVNDVDFHKKWISI